MQKTSKPPYTIPTMAEIGKVPWNGFNAISTFSGCGGSTLGYKMAGFRVLWASEFIPAAQAVYKANFPDAVLDPRDIRDVQPQSILDAIGMQEGELDLVDGSPPCTSFSLYGVRSKNWNKITKHSDTRQRSDDLFWEYARIVRGLQPKVFVAENVAALTKGVAKGYFLNILRELKCCGYDVECRILDAQWLGVPQTRTRAIFIGVRKDLGIQPAFPKPLPYRYSLRDALPWIRRVKHETRGQFSNGPWPVTRPLSPTIVADKCEWFVEEETDISLYSIGDKWDELKPGEAHKKRFSLQKAHPLKPSPCVTASDGNIGLASVVHPFEKRKFTIIEGKRICSFPEDFILTGSFRQQWERLGNAVPPIMMRHIAETIRDKILCAG